MRALILWVACVSVVSAQDMPLAQLLIEGEGWKEVAAGYQFTEGPAVDDGGNVFFVDVPASKIFKIEVATNTVTTFVADSGKASGLMFGGDGRLYACQSGARAIVSYDAEGKAKTVCEDVDVNDLVVTKDNRVYWTDPKHHQVWFCDANGKKRVVDEGIEGPNGIILWADQRTLVVSDSPTTSVWTFRVAVDGGLEFKQPYSTLMKPAAAKGGTGADGMTVDAAGRTYVTTLWGLQVFDPSGRLSGTIAKPNDKFMSNVVFAGPQLDTLYVTCTDKVFSRKVKATGVRNFGAAITAAK